MRYKNSFIVLNNLSSKGPLLSFELDRHWYFGKNERKHRGMQMWNKNSQLILFISAIFTVDELLFVFISCKTTS